MTDCGFLSNARPLRVSRHADPSISEIKRVVAAHFDVPLIEMVSDRRARVVARPRQVAMYLAKKLTPGSLPFIGREFGRRDHTTVIHAVKQVERLCASDSDFAKMVADCEGGL